MACAAKKTQTPGDAIGIAENIADLAFPLTPKHAHGIHRYYDPSPTQRNDGPVIGADTFAPDQGTGAGGISRGVLGFVLANRR